MAELQSTHEDVYNSFMAGHHVIRRSYRFWAGLLTDLTNEQVLMRSLKKAGGLTRGRGISEHQIALCPCLPKQKSMMPCWNSPTHNRTQLSDHHEHSKARSLRDAKDTNIILALLKDCNPFDKSELQTLRSIETCVTATESVNVDRASEIGQAIVSEMVGKTAKTYSEFSFRRSLQAVTLSEKANLKVSGETINIDPQLLFQRLITAAGNMDNISDMFKYELCSIPSSLFDNTGLPRVAQKSTLADAIWKVGDCSVGDYHCLPDTVHVLDGGSLIHKIPWQKGVPFSTICNQYVSYIQQKYLNPIMVVDHQ